MTSQVHTLLVEGEADRGFFEAACKALGVTAKVTVAVPRDVGGSHNTREGVLNALPTFLNQLADGSIARLAVVVDADHSANGAGMGRLVDRVTKIVEPYGFAFSQAPSSGVLFSNKDGLKDFGLWVMPNNENDGMIEQFITDCIRSEETELFDQARAAVASLSNPKFKQIHTCKAEVSTWLAWQSKPGHGLYMTIESNLLDFQRPLFSQLTTWLQHVFLTS